MQRLFVTSKWSPIEGNVCRQCSVLSLVTRPAKPLKLPSETIVLEALLFGLLLQGFCRADDFYDASRKASERTEVAFDLLQFGHSLLEPIRLYLVF
jgi:hypothetical protein